MIKMRRLPTRRMAIWIGLDELKTKNKTNDGMQSKDFMTTTNLDKQSGTTKFTGPGTTLEDLEAYYEGPSRQRGSAQV